MLKKIKTKLILHLQPEKATPTPPIGPALGQHGVNIMQFCKAYNEQTKGLKSKIIPVEITIFQDKTFTFKLKKPPTAILLLEKLKIKKGSSKPNIDFIGTLTKQDIFEIAEMKLTDLNTLNLLNAIKSIKGTAKSLGILIS